MPPMLAFRVLCRLAQLLNGREMHDHNMRFGTVCTRVSSVLPFGCATCVWFPPAMVVPVHQPFGPAIWVILNILYTIYFSNPKYSRERLYLRPKLRGSHTVEVLTKGDLLILALSWTSFAGATLQLDTPCRLLLAHPCRNIDPRWVRHNNSIMTDQ